MRHQAVHGRALILGAAAVAGALLLVSPAAAAKPAGSLTQVAGTAGCLSQTGSGGLCADARAVDGVQSVAVSSDGRHIYSAAVQSNAVAAFARDGGGAIEQLAGTAGCVAAGIAEGCEAGRALNVPDWITLSPDGANAYVTSAVSDATAVFARDAETGALTQLAGAAGCISSAASELTCTLGRALDGAAAVILSPDGANAYVASFNSDSIAVFARDPGTGALTQLAGQAGCVSRTGNSGACASGVGMDGLSQVAVSPDGKHVYATARLSKAVTVYSRDPGTGALTRLAGTDGCVATTASASCAAANGLPGPNTVVVSPDGGHVYVGSFVGASLAVFARDAESGRLTQLAGDDGCVNGDGSQPACSPAVALDGTFALTESPNGAIVYVAAYDSDAVSVFSRDASSGALAQLAGTDGCMSATGTGGACDTASMLDGAHHLALDPSGVHAYVPANVSDAISIFDVTPLDTQPPETTITSGPATLASDASPEFVFESSEDGSTFVCRLDGPGDAVGSSTPCGSPQGYAGLADGEYSFSVVAADGAGNADTTPATYDFTIDTQAPAAPVITEPADGSVQASAVVTLSGTAEPGSTVELLEGDAALGSVTVGAGGEWSKQLTGISDGKHSYSATARDAAANVSAASDPTSVTVDTTVPDTEISSGPSGPTAGDSASFAFSSPEDQATFECRLDTQGGAGTYAACGSPAAYTDLDDGQYTFSVRAVDAAGNGDPSPSTRAFTIDNDAPDTTITAGSAGPTNDPSPGFEFESAGGSSFECRLEGPDRDGAYSSCESPQVYTDLVDGDYMFAVRALDEAGNADSSPATRSFTMDTVAPDTSIASGPRGDTRDSSPRFTFGASEDGSTFQCRLAGPGDEEGTFELCTSPKDYDGLADGSYAFSVRATDAAGNADTSAASRAFTLDTSVPVNPRTPTDPPPPPPGGPASDGPVMSPSLRLSLRPGSELRASLRRGLLLPFTCASPCDVRVTAFVGRGTARRARLSKSPRLVVVARGMAAGRGGEGFVRVRFTRAARRALRRLRTVRLLIRTTVADGGREAATNRRLTLRRHSVPRLRTALRRGLAVWGSCSVDCRAEARLVLQGSRARRLGLGRRSVVVATGARTLTAGQQGAVRLRFTRSARRALARRRSARLTLWVEVTGPGGRSSAVRRSVVLRR